MAIRANIPYGPMFPGISLTYNKDSNNAFALIQTVSHRNSADFKALLTESRVARNLKLQVVRCGPVNAAQIGLCNQ